MVLPDAVMVVVVPDERVVLLMVIPGIIVTVLDVGLMLRLINPAPD